MLGDKLNLPNKELTLLSYVSGDNAGPTRIEARYYASLDDAEFGQAAPRAGSGVFRIDDVAVIAWQEALPLDGTSELFVPHARDFVRVEGPERKHSFRVTLRRRVPVAALPS